MCKYYNHNKLFKHTKSEANSNTREYQVADTSMKFLDVKIKMYIVLEIPYDLITTIHTKEICPILKLCRR
jgi:hypothetical protein